MRPLCCSVVAGFLSLLPSSAVAASYKLVTLEYPPYEYTEGGQVKGLAVEVIREAFKQMGHELTIEVYPWARSIDMFKAGQADGIFTFFRTPEREEFTYFSKEAVITQPITLWVPKDSKVVYGGDLAKMAIYRFGVVSKTSYGEVFDTTVKKGMIKTDEANTIDNCIDKLLNARFDIWISNHYGGVYSLKKAKKFDQVKELSPAVQETPAYVGFSKKKNLEALRNEFDATLIKMKKSGLHGKIIKEYMDTLK
jgi:polar amino acid transport system substrate-binding protein